MLLDPGGIFAGLPYPNRTTPLDDKAWDRRIDPEMEFRDHALLGFVLG